MARRAMSALPYSSITLLPDAVSWCDHTRRISRLSTAENLADVMLSDHYKITDHASPLRRRRCSAVIPGRLGLVCLRLAPAFSRARPDLPRPLEMKDCRHPTRGAGEDCRTVPLASVTISPSLSIWVRRRSTLSRLHKSGTAARGRRHRQIIFLQRSDSISWHQLDPGSGGGRRPLGFGRPRGFWRRFGHKCLP